MLGGGSDTGVASVEDMVVEGGHIFCRRYGWGL